MKCQMRLRMQQAKSPGNILMPRREEETGGTNCSTAGRPLIRGELRKSEGFRHWRVQKDKVHSKRETNWQQDFKKEIFFRGKGYFSIKYWGICINKTKMSLSSERWTSWYHINYLIIFSIYKSQKKKNPRVKNLKPLGLKAERHRVMIETKPAAPIQISKIVPEKIS